VPGGASVRTVVHAGAAWSDGAMSTDRSAASATEPGAASAGGPAAAFRAAVERGDADAAADLFTPDAVFHSPIVHKPYEGREALRAILRAVVRVFEDFRYAAEFSGPDGHVLWFRTRVGERDLDGVDILREGPDGLTELTVMVRPYSAATELRARMAALLAEQAPPR
jgi:hypothetical protein